MCNHIGCAKLYCGSFVIYSDSVSHTSLVPTIKGRKESLSLLLLLANRRHVDYHILVYIL
jgi:hypothetical protein